MTVLELKEALATVDDSLDVRVFLDEEVELDIVSAKAEVGLQRIFALEVVRDS